MKAIRTTVLVLAMIGSASAFACTEKTTTNTNQALQKSAQAEANSFFARVASTNTGQTVVH